VTPGAIDREYDGAFEDFVQAWIEGLHRGATSASGNFCAGIARRMRGTR